MDLIDLYSKEFNIPYEAARALVKAESGFNRKAVSPKGAQGLTQMMPITQREMGVTDPFDPEQSIKGGLGYYAKQREKYGPIGALYAYNWGPGNYDQYLAGKKKTIPKETEKYVNTLAPLFGPTAPMDLQGRPQVPEMLPVSQSVPQQETQMQQPIPPQSTGTPPQDDYESMKIFNPYVQMALGILAGNRGGSKGEAFANAMGGGLGALNAAQRSRAYDQQVRAQTRGARREEEEYNLMKQRSQYMMDFAKKKLEDPNLDPDQRMMWEMAAQGSLKEGVQLMNTLGDNRNAATLNDIKLKMLEEKMARGEEKNVRYELPLPEGHPFYGYSRDEKGELYDKQGIKLTGSNRDYVSEMINKPDGNIVSLPNWKARSDPSQLIQPKEYGRWLNRAGQRLPESMSQTEAMDKGYRFVTEKQATDIDGVHSAVQQIKHLEDMLLGENGVYTKNPIPDITKKPLEAMGSMTDRFLAGTGFGTDPWQENVRLYNEAVDAFSSQLSKLQGQVGTLTEKDVEKAIKMFPKLLPSVNPFSGDFRLVEAKANEARRQFGQVKEFLRSKGVDPEMVFGKATGEKQLIGHTPSGLPIYKEN